MLARCGRKTYGHWHARHSDAVMDKDSESDGYTPRYMKAQLPSSDCVMSHLTSRDDQNRRTVLPSSYCLRSISPMLVQVGSRDEFIERFGLPSPLLQHQKLNQHLIGPLAFDLPVG